MTRGSGSPKRVGSEITSSIPVEKSSLLPRFASVEDPDGAYTFASVKEHEPKEQSTTKHEPVGVQRGVLVAMTRFPEEWDFPVNIKAVPPDREDEDRPNKIE